MQFDQAKFIWLGNTVHALSVEQNNTPVITMHLRKDIDITHNYKRGNRLEIILHNTDKYLIPDGNYLEEIIRIHLMNKDPIIPIKRYCEKYFKKID